MGRPQDAIPLTDMEPAELDAFGRALVALGHAVRDGMVTLQVSYDRICDVTVVLDRTPASARRVKKRREQVLHKEHVLNGANPVVALLEALKPAEGG